MIIQLKIKLVSCKSNNIVNFSQEKIKTHLVAQKMSANKCYGVIIKFKNFILETF